jgi:hypothetical protein
MDRIHLAQGSEYLRALRFPEKARRFVEQPGNYQLLENSSTVLQQCHVPSRPTWNRTGSEPGGISTVLSASVQWNTQPDMPTQYLMLEIRDSQSTQLQTVSLEPSNIHPNLQTKHSDNACKGRPTAAHMCQRSYRMKRRYCTNQQVKEKKPIHLYVSLSSKRREGRRGDGEAAAPSNGWRGDMEGGRGLDRWIWSDVLRNSVEFAYR